MLSNSWDEEGKLEGDPDVLLCHQGREFPAEIETLHSIRLVRKTLSPTSVQIRSLRHLEGFLPIGRTVDYVH